MVHKSAEERQLQRYVETHHIDWIPEAARHGKPWQQVFFWAGANVNIFNVVLGGVVVSIGLTFWWALIAIATGALLGGLLVALHATQGPRLGVPQTIQSRGQFGFYGAAFLFPAVLVLNLGLIAAQLVIQAQSLQDAAGTGPIPVWVILLAVPAVAIGFFGYRLIHRAMQATTLIVGIALAVMFAQGLSYRSSLPGRETTWAAPSPGLFLAGVALLVIDLLSFAPFVSDYTRYLPEDTSGSRLFTAIYAGNVLAAAGTCAVGAYLAALLPSLGPVAAIGRISGPWALVVMAVSLISSDAFNGYTGAFQILALANMWRRLTASAALRIVPFLAVMAGGTVIAVLGYRSFVANLANFLDVLLLIFVPWSAVNLTDFFVVRHGWFHVPSFFTPHGRYGRYDWRGLAAYATGLLAEIPFISQAYYTGPLVKDLGGADISWLVGFAVSAALYLTVVRAWPAPAGEPPTSRQPVTARQ